MVPVELEDPGSTARYRPNMREDVGREVSLVDCDESPLVEFHRPPIAYITREAREIGRTAAELLLRRLEGAPEPHIVTLPTGLVPRASVGPPPKR